MYVRPDTDMHADMHARVCTSVRPSDGGRCGRVRRSAGWSGVTARPRKASLPRRRTQRTRANGVRCHGDHFHLD